MANVINKVDLKGSVYNIASTAYATCATASGTAAKAAFIDGTNASTGFLLETGVTVHVKFTYSNTVANPTLSINGSTAKSIKKYGTTAVGTNEATSWSAGSVVSLTYDGTNWIMNDRTINIATGSSNGTIKVDGTDVAVKGLGDAAYTTKEELVGQVMSEADVVFAPVSHGTHVTAATVKSALGTGTGTSKYLREDGTWVTPPNTTYDVATTSKDGLMSAADKTTLNSINGSYITQSALSGYATEAWVEGKGYLTGITKSQVTTALGYTPPTSNTTYSAAKYNSLGLLKPAYTSTNAVTLTTAAASNTNTPTIEAKTTTSSRYYAVEADKNGVAYVNVPWSNTTYSAVSTSGNAGLMSVADKVKLNGIATGANNYTLPSQYSDTITASNVIKASQLYAATTAGGSTYGLGTSGQILKTNGDTVYWATPLYAGSSSAGGAANKVANSLTISGISELCEFDGSQAKSITITPANIGAIGSITATAGANIGSVGTPSVTASTSGTATTLTFNYLKGAKGDKGDKGDTGSNGTNGSNGTSAQ